jgi:transposase
MSETLKLLIALHYESTRQKEPVEEDIWKGYSYEDLAKLFDRSKASIWTAIHEKGQEAKHILEGQDQPISIENLDAKQKESLLTRLLSEKDKENEQTNE